MKLVKTITSKRWALIVMLTLALWWNFFSDTHAVISSITSANIECPDDSSRKCKSLIVVLGLSKDDREVDSTIVSFTDVDTSTVVLNNTVRIRAKLEDMVVNLPLSLTRLVYNSYEIFDPGEGCAISYNIGRCASSENAPVLDRRTRESDSAAERFMLCCIGNRARRLVGGHCLRSKRDDAYEEYKLIVPAVVMNNVQVDIVQKGTVHRFPMTSLSPKHTTVGFGEVHFLENSDAFPDLYRFHPSANHYAFFRDIRTSNSNRANIKDSRNWFYADLHSGYDQYSLIGIDAVEWAAGATCSQPLHYNTRTHDVDQHIEDQFYELHSQTIMQLIENTAVTNQTQTLQFIINDDANNPVTIRFNRDPAQVTVILTIYDVLS